MPIEHPNKLQHQNLEHQYLLIAGIWKLKSSIVVNISISSMMESTTLGTEKNNYLWIEP